MSTSLADEDNSSDDGACIFTLREPVFFLCRRDVSSELVLSFRRSLERGFCLLNLDQLRLRTIFVGSLSLPSSPLSSKYSAYKLSQFDRLVGSEHTDVGEERCLSSLSFQLKAV